MKVREYGSGGSTLIVLHGILGSSKNWHTIAGKLAQSRYVLVPDLRNHGNSPHGPHSIEAMCDDLYRLLLDYDIKRTDILGHSMGGLVAMQFAFKYSRKLDHLIIEDIAPNVNNKMILRLVQYMQALKLDQISSRADADTMLSQYITDIPVRRFVIQNLKLKQNQSYAWQVNLPNIVTFLHDAVFELPKDETHQGPTLFMAGELSDHNILAQKEEIIKLFPNVTFKSIAGAGHWIHHDAQEEFLKTVEMFLTRGPA